MNTVLLAAWLLCWLFHMFYYTKKESTVFFWSVCINLVFSISGHALPQREILQKLNQICSPLMIPHRASTFAAACQVKGYSQEASLSFWYSWRANTWSSAKSSLQVICDCMHSSFIFLCCQNLHTKSADNCGHIDQWHKKPARKYFIMRSTRS